EAEEELLFHFFELAAFDFPVAATLVEPEGEELVVAAELFGEELVDEGDVVVQLAHFEDLAAAEAEAAVPVAPRGHVVALFPFFAEAALVPAVLDVAVQLDAELVGVQLSGRRRGDAGGVV